MRVPPLAELDLEEIGDYIARDNPARAVSFIRDHNRSSHQGRQVLRM